MAENKLSLQCGTLVAMAKDKVFRFRCSESDFQAWSALAKSEHRSLSDWIRLRLNWSIPASPVEDSYPQIIGPTDPIPTKKPQKAHKVVRAGTGEEVQVSRGRNVVCDTLGHEKFKQGDGWVCKRCGVVL